MRRFLHCAPVAVLTALTAFGPAAASPPLGQTRVEQLHDLARRSVERSAEARADAGDAVQFLYDGLPYTYAAFGAAADTVSTDEVWPGGSAGLSLNGDGVVVHLWDAGRVRETHLELAGAVTWADDSTPGLSNHATHVAGTLVAMGLDPAARGMAPAASVRAYDWRDDAAEMAVAAAQGARLSNHSYGWVRGWHRNPRNGDWYWHGEPSISNSEDVLFGFYDHSAKTWDEIACDAPFYLICNSASNDRGEGPEPGRKRGFAERNWKGTDHWVWSRGKGWVRSRRARPRDGGSLGYDTMTQLGCAKNVLTVGAVDDVPGGYSGPEGIARTSTSGWGPSDDGRVKPDLVAAGTAIWSTAATDDVAYAAYSGSSMATPGVTGSLALLIQHHRAMHGGDDMRSATLKGLALHTADECGDAPGPDYRFGWGLLNTARAAAHISADREFDELIQEAGLVEGEEVVQTWTSDGTVPFKVTLCWTDPPGKPVGLSLDPTRRMLVNDLDLRVIGPDGAVHHPWVLDPARPEAAAARGDNDRDNVEMVLVEGSLAGDYTVVVTHKGTLAGGRQDFSLLISRGTACLDCDPPPPPPPPAPYILWRRPLGGENTIWYMDGPVRLEESGTLPAMPAGWTVAGTGDFDGNGRSDILWHHAGTGENLVWLLDGMSLVPVEEPVLTVSSGWIVGAVDDFDGDGKADILWRHPVTGENVLWLMDGSARRPESGALPTQVNAFWTVAGSGDFDGDGDADLIWRRVDIGKYKIWLLDGLAAQEHLLGVQGPTWPAAVDDFDGDGLDDILWHHAVDGTNTLWLMDGPTVRESGAMPEPGSAQWFAAGSRDLDLDGAADVLWRDGSTGQNLIWFMEGLLPPVPVEYDTVGTPWDLVGTGD